MCVVMWDHMAYKLFICQKAFIEKTCNLLQPSRIYTGLADKVEVQDGDEDDRAMSKG